MSAQEHTSERGWPVASGIELVPTRSLPDRVRAVFHFDYFNAVQSKSFATVFNSDSNFVLSAPTGSGKTAILELAICRLASQLPSSSFKVIYQAPTKALCSERYRDWRTKFSRLNLQCGELTGDTEATQLRHVQNADIIITTPEKWDSVTRKWKDHRRLIELVKLFLIDEVHMLKEDRGACLEAVVSRMKSAGHNVRFVALSATVPNSHDIATWLGRTAANQDVPAAREVFGAHFRPVELDQHVYGLSTGGSYCNDFAFDEVCLRNLPNVIERYSKQKPMIIFCVTRKSAEKCAKALADWWLKSNRHERHWPTPISNVAIADEELKACTAAGVAYHHGGLDLQDRSAIEQAYLMGIINVICCTSTLAVGVNLPCHLVIVKGTVSYQSSGFQEYSDLDMMQMLGRAGRPQFDSSAVAVIMTRQEQVHKYQKMVQGQEMLESRLHVGLIEHLNAEIALKTIHDLPSACEWLKGTFLFVRLAQNPDQYQICGDTLNQDLSWRAEKICQRALTELQGFRLVTEQPHFCSSPLGEAMSKYLVAFDTMKVIIDLDPKPKISEILSVIAQAAELSAIRLKNGEKAMLREINCSPLTRYAIKTPLERPPQKVSLLIQAALGGVEITEDDRFKSQRRSFVSDSDFVFSHTARLMRCIVECLYARRDAVGMRNAMELSRSLAARTWDDSPRQLIQLDKIGPVATRKLIGIGVKTIEDLEYMEPHRIEMALSRNPPFGHEVQARARDFPKLRVTLKAVGKSERKKHFVTVHIRAEVGFLNESPSITFKKAQIQASFLAETSDGTVLDFVHVSARELMAGKELLFMASLHSPQQVVNGFISCDDIAGTLKHATLNPKVPAALFEGLRERPDTASSLTSAPRKAVSVRSENVSDEYGRDLDDEDMGGALQQSDHAVRNADGALSKRKSFNQNPLAGTGKLRSNPNSSWSNEKKPAASAKPNHLGSGPSSKAEADAASHTNIEWQPERLPNGNWKCNHRCKNKSACSHLCCRNGLESKPKPPKSVTTALNSSSEKYQQSTIFQTMRSRQEVSTAARESAALAHETSPSTMITNSARDRTVNRVEDFEELDRIPSDFWDDELGLSSPRTRPSDIAKTDSDKSLFVTNTSSPEKRDSAPDTLDLASDMSDEIPDAVDFDQALHLASTSKRKRRSSSPLPAANSKQIERAEFQEEPVFEQPLTSLEVSDDVDLRANLNTSKCAPSLDHRRRFRPNSWESRSPGSLPESSEAGKNLLQWTSGRAQAAASHFSAKEQPNQGAQDLGGLFLAGRNEPTLEEIDAFVMEELGDVARFV